MILMLWEIFDWSDNLEIPRLPKIVEISKKVNTYEITDISAIISISKKVKSGIVERYENVER